MNGNPIALPEIGPTVNRQIGVADVVYGGQKLIQILILEGGAAIPRAAISMTVEQAKQHLMHLAERIQMLEGNGSNRSGLILPGDLIGGKAFRP